MSAAVSLVRCARRYAVAALCVAGGTLAVGWGYASIGKAHSSALGFAMLVVLAIVLVLLGVSATAREHDGMELGDFSDDEGECDAHEPIVALEDLGPAYHRSRHEVYSWSKSADRYPLHRIDRDLQASMNLRRGEFVRTHRRYDAASAMLPRSG